MSSTSSHQVPILISCGQQHQRALNGRNGDTAMYVMNRIRSFHQRLGDLVTLSPTTDTDALFNELVEFVVMGADITADFHKLLELPEVEKFCEDMRRICSEAEALMEVYWANRLINDEANLSDFPYHENYLELSRMEYHLLCGQGARPQHVIFIGSGPLPLSSITLASQHLAKAWPDGDWSVLNVDICPQANKLGCGVAKKTVPGLASMGFLDCDATKLDSKLVKEFDVIYLAALVGLDMKSKAAVVRDLIGKMKPGARLLLRSADGLRRLLYPVVDESALLEAADGRLEIEVVCHPRTFVVNSVVIARRI